MEKDKKLKSNKKKYILISICVLAFLLLLLLVFRFLLPKGSQNSGVSNREKLSGVYIDEDVLEKNTYTIYNTKCSDIDVCITNMKIVYDGDKGIITYTISNESPIVSGGYLKVFLDGYVFLFGYDTLNSGEEYVGTFEYDGFDFDPSELNNYSVKETFTHDLEYLYNYSSCTVQPDGSYIC